MNKYFLFRIDGTRSNRASLIESCKYFADTTMRNKQLPGYVTWSHA